MQNQSKCEWCSTLMWKPLHSRYWLKNLVLLCHPIRTKPLVCNSLTHFFLHSRLLICLLQVLTGSLHCPCLLWLATVKSGFGFTKFIEIRSIFSGMQRKTIRSLSQILNIQFELKLFQEISTTFCRIYTENTFSCKGLSHCIRLLDTFLTPASSQKSRHLCLSTAQG